jgi:hypothetical protein
MYLPRIKVERSNKALSARGGLPLFAEVIDGLDLKRALSPAALPANRIAVKTSSFDKFRALALGLVAEADGLDATERLAQDPAFIAVCGHVNAANTYGDFLRRFGAAHCRELNLRLIEAALKLRSSLGKRRSSITIKFDSTNHEQHGQKIEGAEFNYKNQFGLDSLVAFDELGFQYWSEVRPGATYTSNGVSEPIDAIFRRVPKYHRRYALADSGFCKSDFFKACWSHNVGFVTAMRGNMFEPLIRRVHNWKPSKRLLFQDGRACEIGTTIYRATEFKETLRVVFMRALKENEQSSGLFGDMRYEYHAFVTNIGEHELQNEKLIEFYRTRSDVENFIKDMKHGFDLKHLPCLSLLANRAYALIAAFAYNLVRFVAHLENPRKPHFAKLVRFKALMLPVQVVTHSRMVSFRFMPEHEREVSRWLSIIKSKFGFAGTDSQAMTAAL